MRKQLPLSGAYSVTPCIKVPVNDPLNFALTTTSSTGFRLASREAGANAPQLVIETVPWDFLGMLIYRVLTDNKTKTMGFAW